MTFEELQKANEQIRTMTISRLNRKTGEITNKEYAEVNQRIKAFRMCYPEGTIQTEIISLENGVVTMKATVSNEGKLLGTGYAYEKESSTQINQTSFIENCETSAVGRALGMCGFGIDTSVASYEEVKQAQAQQDEPKQEKKAKPYKEQFLDYCKANNLDVRSVAKEYQLNGKVDDARFKEVMEDLCSKQ